MLHLITCHGRIFPLLAELLLINPSEILQVSSSWSEDVHVLFTEYLNFFFHFFHIFIPPQTLFVGGYTVFTLSVRPSVRWFFPNILKTQ